MARLRSRLSLANVMSVIAVFMALGGTGYAAVKIPKNAVGASQIKTGGVGSSEVKNGALRKVDFRASDLPVGAAGAQGPQGLQGAKGDKGDRGAKGDTGDPDAFARVQANGTLEPGTAAGGPAQFKGVDAGDIQKPSTGTYCFGGLDMNLAAAVVSMDNADAAGTTTQVASVAIQRGANLGGCDAGHQQARVVVTNVNPALAADAVQDGRFTIWFIQG